MVYWKHIIESKNICYIQKVGRIWYCILAIAIDLEEVMSWKR